MIVALLTDFGTRDHYVGTMKGVVLGVCPDATIVDITHEVPPQDVLGGALLLDAAFSYFPAGTIFLVVVDPGVGTSRRALAATARGYGFVGPDNGVLSLAFRRAGPQPPCVVELTEPRFARASISRTFEGRDRFAPAAAWLARGAELTALGPAVTDPIALAVPVATMTPAGVDGEVLRVDHYGNLITNIEQHMLATIPDPRVAIGAGDIAGVVATYAEAGVGELCALVGSTGHVEIAVRDGSAAALLGLGRGARVEIRGR